MWMREDIRNILLALELSSAQTSRYADLDEVAFRRGFQAALAATAVSFGIPLEDLGLDGRSRNSVRAWLPDSVLIDDRS